VLLVVAVELADEVELIAPLPFWSWMVPVTVGLVLCGVTVNVVPCTQ
jgi:hypothetical protein